MENIETKQKCQRCTEEQLSFYVDFCRKHPEMRTGKNNPSSPAVLQDLWRELTAKLNALRGPTRTAAKWKENLAVWKSQLRGRARKKKADLMLTGGGASSSRVLTPLEERALSTFGTAAVDGLTGIEALGIENFKNSSAFRPITPESVTEISVGEVSVSMADLLDTEIVAEVSPATVGSSPVSTAVVGNGLSSPLVGAGEALSPVLRTSARIPQNVIDTVLSSIDRRDANEERSIQAQLATATALQNLSNSMVAVASALTDLKNLNSKLN